MRQTKLFSFGFVIAVILVIMKLYGDSHGMWENLWYDKVMHTLGGVGMFILSVWLGNFSERGRGIAQKMGWPLFGALIAADCGAVWEVAEAYWPVMTNYVVQSWSDTFFDEVFNVIGGCCAGWWYKKKVQ